jgi:hypothetical protein
VSLSLDPIPAQDPLIARQVYMEARWIRWFSDLVTRVMTAVLSVSPAVHRTAINASIAATTIFTPTQAGDYRVNWFAQITTVAGVASSLAVIISWTSSGVACSKTFAPAILATNVTSAADGDSVTIRPDGGTPVKYATTYVSNPAAAMQHLLDVVAESLT